MERCEQNGWQVVYVGSKGGIEKTIVGQYGTPFYSIASGKLRRYFSWQNFIDPLRILLGIMQAILICLKLKPRVIFSKGGFVSVPVVIAGWLCRIPVIIHESDITPGLANKLCVPFASRVCVTFPQTKKYFSSAGAIVTGTPVRKIILQGDAERGRQLVGLDLYQPVAMFFGGSLGAARINSVVRDSLDVLLNEFQVIHICGKGNRSEQLQAKDGYHQFEYLEDEFGDVLACADLVVSRAGANSIYEMVVAAKPHILIPLSAEVSRGDQIVNARVFEELGYSQIIFEDVLDSQILVEKIRALYQQRETIVQKLRKYPIPDSVAQIVQVIEEAAVKKS
jgi:UDP-N-acetylglucosamine--N-acetylmuramyl-(pentapeptide) pyrophosphoryl-undecaprenol N-acetylglucosamine transferase